MASYHLWHPAYVVSEPLTLEAFVTLGDALLPPRGSAALAETALAAIGLDLAPRTWRLRPMRTHYFSSYRGTSEDWRDEWDLAWRLRVTFVVERAPALPDPPGWGYFDLDSAGDGDASDDGESPCLLIADAREDATIATAQSIVHDAHPDADCVRAQAYARYPQLRCDLGSRARAWYEHGAPEAESTLEALVAAGAAVRFDALAEPDEPPG